MKIKSIVLTDLVVKFILGTNVFVFWGVTINNNAAVASTLKFQEHNKYSLEELSNFNLKLNRNSFNQLGKVILKQQSDFSEYINLIDNGLKKNQYISQVENNILIPSQTKSEQKLLEYVLASLSKLEFEAFSDNSFEQVTIPPVLAQVNYSNIYKDVYDFDITLADNSQIQGVNRRVTSVNRRVPRNTFIAQQSQEPKYFASYFQENKKSDYLSFQNDSSRIVNPNNSSLVSSQPSPNLASLTSSPLIDLPLASNQSQFPFLQNSISAINNQSYLEDNNPNSQLVNEVQAVYLPSTNIAIYQLPSFNVPSTLNAYQKPEHQEELEKKLQKEEQKLEKQKEKMHKKLVKLQQQREKEREKELEKYRKQRQKALIEVIKKQQELQKQRQEQFSQSRL